MAVQLERVWNQQPLVSHLMNKLVLVTLCRRPLHDSWPDAFGGEVGYQPPSWYCTMPRLSGAAEVLNYWLLSSQKIVLPGRCRLLTSCDNGSEGWLSLEKQQLGDYLTFLSLASGFPCSPWGQAVNFLKQRHP